MSKSLQSVTRLTLGSDADTPNCLYLTLKKTRIALIVAILVILATRCFGGILNFRKYSSNEGLPDGLVRAMLQDREGYLWFGTQGGLCRFDGISFTIYSKKDGLKAVIIRSLCEDLEGNIWIGSRDNGLIVYDGKDFRPFTTNLDEIPNPNFIFEIKTDSGGDIWIGAKNGLYRISEGVVNRFTNDDGLPSTSIKSIYEDREHNIWIGTQSGLCRYTGGNFEVPAGDLNLTSILGIAEDLSGTLWVGAAEGLFRSRDGRFEQMPLIDSAEVN